MNLAQGTVVSKLADFVVFGDRNENKTKQIVLVATEGSRLALFVTSVFLSLFYLSLPISFLP